MKTGSSAPKDHCQQRHAHIDSVLGLSEVSGPRIVIELGAYLENTWQRMHDGHPPLRPRHQLWADDEVSAHLLGVEMKSLGIPCMIIYTRGYVKRMRGVQINFLLFRKTQNSFIREIKWFQSFPATLNRSSGSWRRDDRDLPV